MNSKNRARKALCGCFLVFIVLAAGCAVPIRFDFSEDNTVSVKTVTNQDLTEWVPAPVIGGLPTEFFVAEQYWGQVKWNPPESSFMKGRQYTATVTLETMPGWSFSGVWENSFIHQDAAGKNDVTNQANSGVVTISFRAAAGSGLTLANGWLTGWNDNSTAVLEVAAMGLQDENEDPQTKVVWCYQVGRKDDFSEVTEKVEKATEGASPPRYKIKVELPSQGEYYDVYVKVEQGNSESPPLRINTKTVTGTEIKIEW
jgi:hypothetical protein